MSVASLRSDPSAMAVVAERTAAALAPVRVGGGLRIVLGPTASGTAPVRVAEADGYRVRFPRNAAGCEAVIVNTGGGVAGGDHVRFDVTLEGGAKATVSSAAAERVYRALHDDARIDIRLTLGRGALLAWLPQETILYDGAAFTRTLTAEMADDATLTIADVLVLGRRASGEIMTSGRVTDRWRIVRGTRLIHAEAVKLGGEIEQAMQTTAIGGGAHVIATLVHVAPEAADQLDRVRAAVTGSPARVAASAWDGKLVVRALSDRSDHARRAIGLAAAAVTGASLPRVWAT